MNKYREMSDEDAAVAAGAGDEGAFRILFERHNDEVVWQSIPCLGGDYNAAEDVAQVTWLQAHKKLTSFNPAIRPFTSWLHVIRLRRCLNYLRAKKRRLPVFTDITEDVLPEDVAHGDAPASVPQLDIEELPAEVAAAVRVVYLEDRSFPEAAKILGCSVGTAHRRALSGIKLLRRAMGIDNTPTLRRPQVRPADTRREIQMLVA